MGSNQSNSNKTYGTIPFTASVFTLLDLKSLDGSSLRMPEESASSSARLNSY